MLLRGYIFNDLPNASYGTPAEFVKFQPPTTDTRASVDHGARKSNRGPMDRRRGDGKDVASKNTEK